MDDSEVLGPVDFLIIEFPGNRMTGEGVPLLLDLVDRNIIRILDLAFIRKDTDGSVIGLRIEDMDSAGAEHFMVFQGASSGLLDHDDVVEAAHAIEPGSAAGIIVYENVWAKPLAAAWLRGGAQVVAAGRISAQEMLAAV